MNPFWIRIACCLCVATAVGAAHAQTASQTVQGDVIAVEGTKLQLHSRAGQNVAIGLPENVRVTVRVPVTAAAIKQGAYVGVTAIPQPDGTLRASIVSIFPEALRGVAEGHAPMPSKPGNTMTNATVASVGGGNAKTPGTMTNATVANVGGVGPGETLQLKYAGGEKTAMVSESTAVIMSEPGDRSALAPGSHVIVYASPQADGSLTATRVSVGKNGSVPPQ